MITGLVTVAIVGGLFAYFDYRTVVSTTETLPSLVGVFTFGFVLGASSGYTRLLTPGWGAVAVTVGVAAVEVTTPAPQKVGELGGNTIIDGSVHVTSYADTWYVWLSLLLVAGVAEFAIRRGYALGDDRLRRLPDLPLSRRNRWTVVAGCSGLIGTATAVVLLEGHLWDTLPGYGIGFAAAAIATAVPLAALLSRGLLLPFVLYGWTIANALRVEIFTAPDSGLHIAALSVAAIGFAIVAGLELLLRSRFRGWDGGRFVTTAS